MMGRYRRLVSMTMLVSMLAVFGAVSCARPVAAFSPLTTTAVCATGLPDVFGFQPWYACLKIAGDGTPSITKLTDLYGIAFVVVDWIIKAAAYVAAGMIFYMLFKIAMSRGNASQYSTAIRGIRDAVIGLVIALLSISILNFVAGAF